MQKIKILIADDSIVYRSQIRAALNEIPHIEVIGASSNGKLALERMSQIQVDLLILDLEMPEMDGLQMLTEMKKLNLKCKVLVFSSVSKRGASITMDALRLGASDFIPKPNALDDAVGLSADLQPSAKIRSLIEPKIQALFPNLQGSIPTTLTPPNAVGIYPKIIWDLLSPRIIVIGSSTGGPTVLEKIFTGLNGPLNCPIVIAQHMPPIFTATLAERLSRCCGIPAMEAVHGMSLEKNCIYLAPGDYHLKLQGTQTQTTLVLDQGPQINSVRPAVDPLFASAASIYKEKCLGIVLTGMGADGKVGAEEIKKCGGAVVIQSEATCVVFGMPGAVFAVGAFDRISTPDEIIQILNEKAGSVTYKTGTIGR